MVGAPRRGVWPPLGVSSKAPGRGVILTRKKKKVYAKVKRGKGMMCYE